MHKTKHLIENYDQVLIRLADLTAGFSDANKNYMFAIGDLFNQEIPAGVGSKNYHGEAFGLNAAQFQQHIGREIDSLLEDSGAIEYVSRDYLLSEVRPTARAWNKSDRNYDVAFTVYRVLSSHQDLIRDGMTVSEAREARYAANNPDGRPISNTIDSNRIRTIHQRPGFNPHQWLRITSNQLAGQLKAFDTDASADEFEFDDEATELVKEMYLRLDAFVAAHDIEYIWDLEAAA